MSHRIAIALLGKGSVNHLHREELVRALRANGFEVRFIVRDDYIDLLPRLPDCAYSTCRIEPPAGLRAKLGGWCQSVRALYPAWDEGKRARLRVAVAEERRPLQRLQIRLRQLLAHSPVVLRLLVWIEGLLFDEQSVKGIDPKSLDQLVLLGLGIFGTEAEGSLTWWARHHGISVINMVGNYDNLSSKGFRGVPLDHLFVWGKNMEEDAQKLHGVPADRISRIGSIRYNTVFDRAMPSRESFFSKLGLDPSKKTLLFAGAMFEYHYFEMLSVFEQMRVSQPDIQLILRLYPSKGLMRSPFIEPLVGYASGRPGVYVSIGDPHYKSSEGGREPIYIDETELWCALRYSDVVINIFSTISLEACIFDKPAVNMWYFERRSKGFLRTPQYIDFSRSFHNRRLLSYGAIRTATSRAELVEFIQNALQNPAATADARKTVVEDECGLLDGHGAERFMVACSRAYEEDRRRVGSGGGHG
jgi:hypothetical protein